MKINYTIDEKNRKIIGEYTSKNNVRYRATAKCFATDEYSEDNGKDIVKAKIKIKQLIRCHNEEYKRNENLREQLERSEKRLIRIESQWIEHVAELIKKGVCCDMKDICPECGSTEFIYNDDIALYVCAVCGKELSIYMQ